MSDQKTIIGMMNDARKNLFNITMEDITGRSKRYFLTSITNCMGEITTVLIDEKNWYLLVGDEDGRLLQMSFDFQGNLGKILKDFGNLELNRILSSYLLGDIAVFGGRNGKLAFINTRKREFLGYNFDLAPQLIYSIELFWIQNKSQPKALLMVSGEYYDYDGKTDVLDVTMLFPKKIRSQNSQNILKSYQEISEIDTILDTQLSAKPIQLYPKKSNKIKKDLS